MKNILLIISVLFFFNFPVSAKSEFLKCDNFLFNIKMPIVGFDKVYIYKKNQWVKVKKFDITEKQYLIFNLEAYLLKCENEKCKVNIAISKVAEGKSYTEYRSIVNNDFCQIDGSNKCFKRNIGENLQKGYCSRLEELNIN